MDMSILRELTSDQLKSDLPDFGPGDTVRVHVRVIEGDKERVQVFEGNVIQRKGSGIQESVTIRKITQGVAVERIFPVPFTENLPNRNDSARARPTGSPLLHAFSQGQSSAH